MTMAGMTVVLSRYFREGEGSALLHGIQDLVSGGASPGGCTMGCGGAGFESFRRMNCFSPVG